MKNQVIHLISICPYGPCEVTSLNPDLYSSPVELHKYAQRHHTNFRYNGITYRYYKK